MHYRLPVDYRQNSDNMYEKYCTLCPKHCLLGVYARSQEAHFENYTPEQMDVIWAINNVQPDECQAKAIQ